LITPFPVLPAEPQSVLDCPDFRQETFMEKVKALFEKDKTTVAPDSQKVKKKRKSIFDIFRRKKKTEIP